MPLRVFGVVRGIEDHLRRGFDEPLHRGPGVGLREDGGLDRVDILPAGSTAANPAFDVTPARLITGLITERGVAQASRAGLEALFPERSSA